MNEQPVFPKSRDCHWGNYWPHLVSLEFYWDNIKLSNTDSVSKEEECYSINNLPNFGNDTTVKFCSNAFLQKPINFKGISNLSIYGHNGTVIRCTNESLAGLSFEAIDNLVISDITLINCMVVSKVDQILENKSRNNSIKASIHIQESSNVRISGLTVTNGPGTGLSLFDINGQLDIVNSTFQGNGWNNESGGNGI